MSAKGIVIVDVDAGIPLEDRKEYAAAQQAQLAEDVAPAWGITALPVRASNPSSPALPGEIQIRLLDKPTMSGALGYHDVTPEGVPIAYVFCGLAKESFEIWTSIASHEVCELTCDPYLGRTVQMSDGFWDMEVCDRVEQDAYRKSATLLSNFNYPACFEPPVNRKGVKYDHMGLSDQPNQVRPGGYAQKFDPSKGWVQVGQMSAYRQALSDCGLGRVLRRQAKTPRPNFLRRILGR